MHASALGSCLRDYEHTISMRIVPFYSLVPWIHTYHHIRHLAGLDKASCVSRLCGGSTCGSSPPQPCKPTASTLLRHFHLVMCNHTWRARLPLVTANEIPHHTKAQVVWERVVTSSPLITAPLDLRPWTVTLPSATHHRIDICQIEWAFVCMGQVN